MVIVPQKKLMESYYLESFFKKVHWNATIIRYGNDRGCEPDFIVDIDGCGVGIEVTELFKSTGRKGSENKAHEKQNQKYLSSLATYYYDMGGFPIRLQLHVVDNISRYNVSDIVIKLKNSVSNLQDWGIAEIQLEDGIVANIRRLPESALKYTRWNIVSDHVGYSYPITLEMLQRTIAPKYDKVVNYKLAAKRIILVVYADRTWNSGLVNIQGKMEIPTNGFDSIYLYFHPECTIKIS